MGIGGTVDTVRLELPPLPASVRTARHAVAELASQFDCDTGAARIAVSEAVGNCVLHAYVGREPGPILVLAREIDGYLVIIVADCGGGIRPRLDSPGLGIGLPIVGRIADDVRIESDGAGNRDRDQPRDRFGVAGATRRRDGGDRRRARARQGAGPRHRPLRLTAGGDEPPSSRE